MSTASQVSLTSDELRSESLNLNPTRLYLLGLASELKSWLASSHTTFYDLSAFWFVLTENGNFGYAGYLSSFEGETMVGVASARISEIGVPKPQIHVRLTPSSTMLHVAGYTTGEDSAPFLQGPVALESGALVCFSEEKLPNVAGHATRGPVIRMGIGNGPSEMV